MKVTVTTRDLSTVSDQGSVIIVTGATPQMASAVGARLMTGDPVTEAENVEWPR